MNAAFTAKKATYAGDYIIAVAAKLISQIRSEQVVKAVTQVLT